MTSITRQTLAVLRKDLRLGWRTRGRVLAEAAFGATALLLFSFAVGPDADVLAAHAGGYLWLALLLAAILTLAESFRVEVEDEAMEGLRLLPVDPRALFLGKALANTLRLIGLGAVLLPLALLLYGARVAGSLTALVGFVVLGAAGLAAPGTLHTAMTARTRGSDVLLPLLFLPLTVPVLVAAVKGSSLSLAGDPMEQIPAWATLLGCFDVIYWSLGSLLLGRLLES